MSATHGTVDVQAGLVTPRLGSVEPEQSVGPILGLRASAQALVGQALVQQASAYFEGGHVLGAVVAFGTPRDHLPAPGAARRLP